MAAQIITVFNQKRGWANHNHMPAGHFYRGFALVADMGSPRDLFVLD